MDVEAVQAAGAEAMAHCRAGKGPIILEMKTYRYRGHSMSDPAKYRTREEVTEVREKRDPIEHFGKKLIERGVVNEDDLKQMDTEVKAGRRRRRRIRHRKPGTGRRRTLHGYLRLMSTEILMPALSPTMEEGKLSKWLVKEGDTVKSGDILAEIETDKATMEFEAVDEGRIGKILVPEGTEGVKVNSPIATLAGRWRSAAAPRRAKKAASAQGRKPKRRADKPTQRRRAARAAIRSRRRSGSARRHRDGDDQTVRDALRDAMAEEMRRDELVFLMGEEVAAVSGRLQDSPGPAGRIRRPPGHRHAHHRAWLYRPRHRRGVRRPEAHRRIHDLEFRHAGDGPDHQLRRQDPLHVGRPDELPHRVPRPQRRRRPRRRPAQPGLFLLVCHRARHEGDRALFRRRRQGPAQGRDPRSQSGDLPGKRNRLWPVLPGAQAGRFRAAHRQGAHRAAPARTSPSSPIPSPSAWRWKRPRSWRRRASMPK